MKSNMDTAHKALGSVLISMGAAIDLVCGPFFPTWFYIAVLVYWVVRFSVWVTP